MFTLLTNTVLTTARGYSLLDWSPQGRMYGIDYHRGVCTLITITGPYTLLYWPQHSRLLYCIDHHWAVYFTVLTTTGQYILLYWSPQGYRVYCIDHHRSYSLLYWPPPYWPPQGRIVTVVTTTGPYSLPYLPSQGRILCCIDHHKAVQFIVLTCTGLFSLVYWPQPGRTVYCIDQQCIDHQRAL